MYVISSGVLNNISETIGENHVGVPTYFYKIILQHLSSNKYKSICFLIPNEKGTKNLIDYTISIDSLEHLTGYNFFYQLPNSVQQSFELGKDTNYWFSKINEKEKVFYNNQNQIIAHPSNQSAIRLINPSERENIDLVEKLNALTIRNITVLDSIQINKLNKGKPFKKLDDILPIINNDTTKYKETKSFLKRN